GNKGESDEADAVEPLAAGEGTDDDLIQRVAGPQEQTAVNAPAGHLHQGSSIRDKAQKSGHALYKRKNSRSSDTLRPFSSPISTGFTSPKTSLGSGGASGVSRIAWHLSRRTSLGQGSRGLSEAVLTADANGNLSRPVLGFRFGSRLYLKR